MFLQIQSDVQSLFFLEGGGIQKQIMRPGLPFGWILRVKIPIQIYHIQHFTWTSLFSFLEKRGGGGGGGEGIKKKTVYATKHYST